MFSALEQKSRSKQWIQSRALESGFSFEAAPPTPSALEDHSDLTVAPELSPVFLRLFMRFSKTSRKTEKVRLML